MKKYYFIFGFVAVAIVITFLIKEQTPVSSHKHEIDTDTNLPDEIKSSDKPIPLISNAVSEIVVDKPKFQLHPEMQNVVFPEGNPCPDLDLSVFIEEALQAFRKNLSIKEKDEALQKIDSIGDPMIMPVIMMALEDDNPDIRGSAIDAIGSLDNPCVIPAVEKALNDTEPTIRQDAVSALLRVEDENANDALIKALNDPDEDVRESAIEVLLYQESPETLPAAKAAIQINDPEMQKNGISILEDIPSPAAIDAIINYGILSDYDEVKSAAVNSLQKLTGEKFNSYQNWIDWWDINRKSCPENISADEWSIWWKERHNSP